MKLVSVRWGDAWVDGSMDFTEQDALHFEPIIRNTIGFFVAETDKCIILATDYYEKDKSWNCPMIIPSSWILNITYIDAGGEGDEDTTH
jgi:hypothetical protein